LNGPSDNATVLQVIQSAVQGSASSYGPFQVNFNVTGINFFIRIRALLENGPPTVDAYSARFTIAQNPQMSASATMETSAATVVETTSIAMPTTTEQVSTAAATTTTTPTSAGVCKEFSIGMFVLFLLFAL
jgi:hypothetical protein